MTIKPEDLDASDKIAILEKKRMENDQKSDLTLDRIKGILRRCGLDICTASERKTLDRLQECVTSFNNTPGRWSGPQMTPQEAAGGDGSPSAMVEAGSDPDSP